MNVIGICTELQETVYGIDYRERGSRAQSISCIERGKKEAGTRIIANEE